MKTIIALIILGAVLFGCISTADITANPDTPFTLKINQSAVLPSENLFIKFIDVTEDSRCPSDVVCVWAGRATATLQLFKPGNALFHTNISTYSEASVNYAGSDYAITIVSLEPAPQSTMNLSLEDYSITLSLSKK